MKGAAKMYVKLTISERLKDLRVERHLTLEQLADATGLSKSALGKYETEDFKDISPFAITTLAEFYGVSTDYLLGLTENKNPANAELQALHLQDDAIDSLRNGKYNKRLLSELVAHDKFQQFMIDMEIYVDRIADSRVDDMNAMLEIVRKQAMQRHGAEADDLYMRTLELGQVKTEDYFARILSDDLAEILNDIRQAHKRDATTADETSAAEEVGKRLQEAAHYEGSLQEKQARVYLASLGIDYEAITKEEFATLIGILSKSKKLQIRQGSQRGKRKRK
jgi:transcriptional regulator with XRE-family HTH domain